MEKIKQIRNATNKQILLYNKQHLIIIINNFIINILIISIFNFKKKFETFKNYF